MKNAISNYKERISLYKSNSFTLLSSTCGCFTLSVVFDTQLGQTQTHIIVMNNLGKGNMPILTVVSEMTLLQLFL